MHVERRAQLRSTKVVASLAIAVIVAIGAWTKFASLGTMATHVDDVGVATVIMEARHFSTDSSVRAQLLKKGSGGPLSAVMRRLDAAGRLDLAVRAVPYVIVPVSFTYAPAQFFVTAGLLRPGLSYRDVIWRGRLPSALAGTLAALLAALVAVRIRGRQAAVRSVVAAAVMACSWELLLLSSQMHNYAAGVTGALLLMLMLLSTRGRPSFGEAVAEGVALAALPWLHYQILFLLPPYLLVRAWRMLGVMKSKAQVARTLVLVVLPTMLSVALLYHYFLGRHVVEGVHWNAGANGEFGFSFAPGLTLLGKISYALRFFVVNGVESLRSLLSFVPESSGLFVASTALMLLLAGAGALSFGRDRSTRARAVSIFLLASAGVWVVLVVLGKVTLSPTRHSVILLPFAALLIAEGVCALGDWLNRPRTIGMAVAAAIVASFLWTRALELAARKDPFDDARIQEMVAQAKPDLIITYRCSWNLRVMQSIDAPLFDSGCVAGPNAQWTTARPVTAPRRILFISTSFPLDSSEFQLQRRVLNDSMPSPLLTRPWSEYRATTLAAVLPQRTIEFSGRIARGADNVQTALLSYGGLRATLLELTERVPARP